jgi:hypothetical protein
MGYKRCCSCHRHHTKGKEQAVVGGPSGLSSLLATPGELPSPDSKSTTLQQLTETSPQDSEGENVATNNDSP